MSSERIIGEFYAALPLGSGGKPHNASATASMTHGNFDALRMLSSVPQLKPRWATQLALQIAPRR
jgi:hypothetical protein